MSPAARFEDWPRRLAELLAGARNRPLAWGSHDCCSFAADAVQALTGLDPAAALRGRYHDVKGARRIVKARGGSLETLLERLAKRHGWPETPVGLAKRGDLLLLEPPEPALPGWPQHIGVSAGALAASPGTGGLVYLPAAMARRAWSI